MDPWKLPETAVIGGEEYETNTDFRDIMQIMRVLTDPDRSEYVNWLAAIQLFYVGEIPPEHEQEAMEYLASFISYGEKDNQRPGPRLLDWEQDAQVIVADVNKVAGYEVRSVPYLHWWTFLSFFQAIGEGQLSTLITIREKLRRGKKLEKWEQDYYRQNKQKVDLRQKYSAEELAEQQRLKQLLDG